MKQNSKPWEVSPEQIADYEKAEDKAFFTKLTPDKKKIKMYCGSWRGKKQIYQYNHKTFVYDFYRVRTIVVCITNDTMFYLEIKRRDLWELAKTRFIRYRIDNTVYQNGRTVMIIY